MTACRIYPVNACHIKRMMSQMHARIQTGAGGGPDPHPLEYHKNIVSLTNTCPDNLENDEATKPAFIIGLSSARQRNANVGVGSAHEIKDEVGAVKPV